MTKKAQKYPASKIILLTVVGILTYFGGLFILGLAAFATGGSGLFGVQPHGTGAVFQILTSAWLFIYPVAFPLGVVIWHQDSSSDKKSK